MENLYKIKSILIVISFSFLSILNAQDKDTFYVFHKEGSPTIINKGKSVKLKKGSAIQKGAKVVLGENEVLSFIGNDGSAYKLSEVGEFDYKDLKSKATTPEKESFSKKYFSYVWNQFTKKEEQIAKSGVVVRGSTESLLQFPQDGSKLFGTSINFKWTEIKGKTKNYYLVLVNKDMKQVFKVGTKGTDLTLFVDDNIIISGLDYKWAISESKYEKIDNLEFNSFHILTVAEYGELKNEIKEVSKTMKALGMKKGEIKDAICQDYKICY